MRRLTEDVHQTNDFQMQHPLDMLHFREQLFTAIFFFFLATIVEGDPKAPFSIAYYTKV